MQIEFEEIDAMEDKEAIVEIVKEWLTGDVKKVTVKIEYTGKEQVK